MTNKDFNLNDHLPLVAIIRGVEPADCIRVTQILIEEGFSMIEVPLNSPDALTSIKMLVEHFGDQYLIGAGTVTTPEKAQAVIDTGANLIVTPNFNEQVVKMSAAAGCVSFPGVVTPTEAFAALSAGATGLKLFPVSVLGLDGFKALNSVLPSEAICLPVGGINPTIESMKPYLDIGAKGFGLGASLYKPGLSDDEIRANARAFNTAFKASIA
ncbi:2-dehydro-3-deoxy-6-phosphogalactonate aldolase [Vibrio sp. 10N.261.46.E12]|uniref:2-dehydro-3-deoxy-6-phosphogalactonate aldolase n=1 Tax=unclassified Vibrio TaxID=2614977 RepID=UPI000976E8D1|nr:MULTISPECIES: 2-dehydro-3-deoxy-6-phosphogalactonate aldolase [unclassified Vibrio]OMO35895.1 2-dehydro-3-deoxy-6-phosphogalactonate aldolase [Vibrio sp. 10N.261.45.E1]PMJ28472.1 2-dehydro-3-deoxy-6-phosphogalactonate aldolase [Vibrio sp. 10N.286.45.B6]PML98510.1 2-dehydro-3-deoxy-6-phosphogalactonate aldolase [Vibrio sp. 10N.261.49.E11]PMM68263.1 2-dehydro-3-deoxy-6-phosphogalactonate aldolase [Vibrio sp. 10N.261.46.F12]PMM83068.1 2-dehydro-3-deoxy-6-phosphogalactonate aldolase [Vibrio sp.